MADNEARELQAITDGLAHNPPFDARAYQNLVTPYPVWAGIHECGIPRTGNKHKIVSYGLFHDEFETCIDLDKTELDKYFKTRTRTLHKVTSR